MGFGFKLHCSGYALSPVYEDKQQQEWDIKILIYHQSTQSFFLFMFFTFVSLYYNMESAKRILWLLLPPKIYSQIDGSKYSFPLIEVKSDEREKQHLTINVQKYFLDILKVTIKAKFDEQTCLQTTHRN